MSEISMSARIGEGFQVIAEVGGHEYVMDQPKEVAGGHDTGTVPGGVLLASLAGCNVMVAKMYLDSRQIAYDDIGVNITGAFEVDDNGQYDLASKVELVVDADLSAEELERLAVYVERQCAVGHILKRPTTIETTIKRK